MAAKKQQEKKEEQLVRTIEKLRSAFPAETSTDDRIRAMIPALIQEVRRSDGLESYNAHVDNF